MSRVKIAGFLAVSLLFGCASAGDRLQEGLVLEASGDAYAASLRYLDALEKDSSFEPARVRLAAAGARALREGLGDAEAMSADGTPIAAARRLPPLATLYERARGYGVRLELPSAYQDRRVDLMNGASDALEVVARRADRAGDWPTARNALRELRLHMATNDER
jgi:hypothetical protein